ncbi:Zn-dependent hydrolase [Amorphus sp. MBR-141]
MTETASTSRTNLKVNGNRLWASLMDMAQIGPGVAGGNNRQALTTEDGEARRLLADWCQDIGLTVRTDRLGNMFARREGTEPDLDPVFVGSHLDTQPTGGKYDGVLGVLAALEAMRVLTESGVATRRPIVLVNWTNEEGTRYTPPIGGSSGYVGRFDVDHILDQCDAKGLRFRDELARIGWLGDERVGARPMHAYLELHIEQGPLLEAEGLDIGVVTHGQGTRWIEGVITGRDAHTGSTPMTMRRNAARGLARLIDLANDIAMAHAPDAVGTIAHVVVEPNSPNVIPGRIVFTADFRSHRLDVLTAMQDRFEREAAELCAALDLAFSSTISGSYDPPEFDPRAVAAVRDAAEQHGYAWRDMVSGAGHDASIIAATAPAAMVFCPCVGGLSHNEAEEITPQWAEAGANVLLGAAVALADSTG